MTKIILRSAVPIFLFIGLFVFYISPVRAQVTVGSEISVVPGSLLDLKEKTSVQDQANSSRGLALPRVYLTDKYNLYPMFETFPGSGLPTSQYAGANKAVRDAEHTGLVVYNLNKCDDLGWGTYVWVGYEWQPLKDATFITPGIIILTSEHQWIDKNTAVVHLPSGKDLRTFPANKKFQLSLDWKNVTDGPLNRVIAPDASFGALQFTNVTYHPSAWPNPVATTPVTYDYYINDMSNIITSENPYESYPFRSRETSVTFDTPLNECNEKKTVTVRLNQTNYRIAVKRENKYFNMYAFRYRNKTTRFNSNVYYYRFLMLPPYSGSYATRFAEETNARFYANYQDITPGILIPTVVPTNIPAKGGKELINNTSLATNRTPAEVLPRNENMRYKTAGVVTYTDTAAVARYYPVEIHFVQCQVDGYDMSKIKDGDALSASQWGNNVLKHTDQDGNTFLSAVFGNVRWMITNLAAKKYAQGSPNQGESITPYVKRSAEDHAGGIKQYAYPVLDMTNTATSDIINWGVEPSGWRSEEGIFYNWYAATGRAYGDNAGNREAAEGNNSFTTATRVQGICPKGWHLPTDQEWANLEKEVYKKSIDTYATYDAVDRDIWATPSLPAWNSDWEKSRGYRGTTKEDSHLGHGGALKCVCPPKSTTNVYTYMQGSKGYSKEFNEGGFNAILAGRIKPKNNPSTADDFILRQESRAYDGTFWANSQNSLGDAWIRSFNIDNGGVYRDTYIKTSLLSVRCVKD